MRLILASSSPRRAELLTAAGFTFDVCVADVDESVRAGEPPRDYVTRLALEKASRVLALVNTRAATRTGAPPDDVLVIGADTAVIVDDEVLGKPLDDADARRMIARLSGRAHLVLTGVSLCSRSAQRNAVEETTVFMAALSDDQLDWYVKSGEGLDKAGAYAIQGLAARFVTRIEGSYSNVVGLPVALVDRLVREADAGVRSLASRPQ